jgi:hypothetical protein
MELINSQLSQLPKPQTPSEGVMFLEISSGSGFAPVVGVEPKRFGCGGWI